jgi:hypothetical protein
VRDQLISSLADGEIQQRILVKGEISLEETIVFISGEESGKWSKRDLTGDAVAAVSTYRREQRQALHTKKCTYCGGSPHSTNNTPSDREKECPAWGKSCKNCGVRDHFADVCRRHKA